MPTNAYNEHSPASAEERNYLESLVREDYERCHPGDTFEDLKRRASFSKEDRAAEGPDGIDAYRLECQILQREAIEQPQSIRIEVLAIRGEQAFDAEPVSRIGFRIQMKDGRRLVDDPRIVAADEMREIVIL